MRAFAVLLLVLALGAPPAALAQTQGGGGSGDAFGPLPTAPTPAPTPVATVQTSSSTSGDSSRTTLYVIAAGLLVTFLIIGRVIFRDARRHAPAGEDGTALRDAGPHRHAKRAKAHARAKGKAQKAARRRNR